MGKLGGFLKYRRVEQPERDPRERVGDYREFMGTLDLPVLQEQGARCMECGVPFCHNGCHSGRNSSASMVRSCARAKANGSRSSSGRRLGSR